MKKTSYRSDRGKAKHALAGKASHGLDRHKNPEATLSSIGSERGYRDGLTGVQTWITEVHKSSLAPENLATHVGDLDPKHAQQYLTERAEIVGQSQLDKDRLALNIATGTQLDKVISEHGRGRLATDNRAYTLAQTELIGAAQTERNRISTAIAAETGLRAHELFTLERAAKFGPVNHRPWSDSRHDGRTGIMYVVVGKGGLQREVMLSSGLADRLEDRRLDKPRTVTDREIHYQQRYDIGGGRAWSQSFTSASTRALGWTNGAHGCRHGYAQDRMEELQNLGHNYQAALSITSQNLGHFSPKTTLTYLR